MSGDANPAQPSNSSNVIEKIVEYRFLADLTAELFRRGTEPEVLRADVDAFGYDLAIEAGGSLRYVQLKATREKGARAKVSVNLRLASKPSGCLIWIIYDAATFQPLRFRWLGGPPGTLLPLPSDAATARHTKPNARGEKAPRANHRVVRRGDAEWIRSYAELADRMFVVPTPED